jgi:DNA transformation protein
MEFNMGELTKLPNIAAKLEAQLADVGITSIDELKHVGSREAWLRILSRDPSACLMRLSALEGAIQGVRWHYLDDETKISLKAFYSGHKGSKGL